MNNNQPNELSKAIAAFESMRQMNATSWSLNEVEPLYHAAKQLQQVGRINAAYAETMGNNAETIFGLQQERDSLLSTLRVAEEALKHARPTNMGGYIEQALTAIQDVLKERR